MSAIDRASDRSGLRDLLAFYAEAGIDVAMGEAAVDRFVAEVAEPPPGPTGDAAQGADAQPVAQPHAAPEAPPRAPLNRQTYGVLRQSPPPPLDAPPAPDAAIMAAREAARGATSLEALRAMLDSFEGCGLRFTAKRLVFADGNPQARVMFVGEAPGREEDIEGLPFVGRSGQLLDRMMAAIGLDRTTAYIANVIPWRPPGNRTPTPQESQICLPFVKRQIELANPDILACLGGPAAAALLGISEGIRKSRGRWRVYHTGTREIRAIATFHPAYLLRTPLEKRFAWRDFLAIKTALLAP
jgi:uracil-DNA glycosylase